LNQVLRTPNRDIVAVQGIANSVREATGDQFVAGLGQRRIIEELCWFPEHLINGNCGVESTYVELG
jgi:hypothetical protein